VSSAATVERWLAWRYLATRQREGFISFIAVFSLFGVALGVATLIVVLSVMGGFREQLVGRLVGMNGHIVLTAQEGTLRVTPELLAGLAARPEIRAVRVTLGGQALVQAGGQTRAVSLRGVRNEDIASRGIVATNIVAGDAAPFATRGGAVIGDRLRMSLGLRFGRPLTVVTHRVNPSGSVAPRYVDYEVLASFHTRRWEFDSAVVFVPLDLLQEDLDLPADAASSIDIDVLDPSRAPELAGLLRDATGLRAASWQALNARFVWALKVERAMMFIILSLIVLVAALNVVASFTMLVRVKRGSVAILRTMGAARATVVRAFFLAAAGIGTLGTIAGAALGLSICAALPALGRWLSSGAVRSSPELDFVATLPTRVSATEVGLVLGVSLLLSLAAAAYPAWRAAGIAPAEALRDG